MPFRVRNQTEGMHSGDRGSATGVQVEFCAPHCLLRQLPAEARCLRTGQTEATRYGMMDDGRLYVSILSRPRPASHVLGSQRNTLDARQRWSRLIGVETPSLMRVRGCCDCTAAVDVIRGLPLVDANTMPLWLKKMMGDRQVFSHDQPVSFARWAGWMASLAEGLDALHKLGLAHGDPFPFNVLVAEGQATWVDFSHLSDDPEQQAKDLWAFLFFTVLYSLAFCAEWSPALQRRLVGLFSTEDWADLAGRLRAAFADEAGGLQPAPAHDQLIAQFMGDLIEQGFLERRDPAGRIGQTILAQSSPFYYSGFLEWLHIGSQTRSQLELERARHKLVEDEQLRLRVPRGELDLVQGQLHEKLAENRELLAKHDWLAEERQRLLAEDERKLTEVNKLLSSNQWLAEENARLVQMAEQAGAEQKRLVGLLDAESERLAGLIEQASAENARLVGLIEQAGAENARLVHLTEQTGAENARLVGLIDQLNAENVRLVNLIEQAGADYRQAQARLEELTQALGQRDHEIHRLVEVVREAGENQRRMEEHLRTLTGDAQAKADQIRDLAEANEAQALELARLAGELEASRSQQLEARQQLDEARLQLSLFLDRKDGYYKTVQKHTGLLIEAIQPLLGNLDAFRVSKTYKIGILASAFSKMPLGGKISLLYRLMQRVGLRRNIPVEYPENGIILTIHQLAMQIRNDIQFVHSLQITRPQLPQLSAPPARPAPAGGSAAGSAQPPPQETAGPVLACQPLVSVLLPVYNHSDMLGGAVESVLRQTYANWEIIILDDGSTDGIDAVLERFKNDPRIHIYHQQNQKLPNTLTHLHRLARGEFITWTSADNLMAPPMLERLVEAISQNPGTVLVYADTALIDEHGAPLSGEGYRDHNRDTAVPELMRLTQHVEALGEEPDNFINACFLYRAQAARAVGPYAADLNALEDYDFFLRLRRAGHCRHAGNAEPLYFYRVHRRTMSEEVLTKEREPHVARSQQLIKYDKARGQWFERRWNVLLSEGLPREERDRLRELLDRLPVNFLESMPKRRAGKQEEPLKTLRFAAPGEEAREDGAVIVCGPADYRLLHVAQGAMREIGWVARGQDIPWLAVKSRRQINPAVYYEFARAGNRPVIGTHQAFADIDVPATIELLNAHPDLFFALIDDERRPDPARGQAIASACANSVYLGPRKYGHAYWGYADFASVLCPPLAGKHPRRAVLQAQQLALACGRWLLYPAHADLDEMPPFAVPYQLGDVLPQAWRCEGPLRDPALLDRYLHHNSEAGALDRALRLAGTALQEAFIARPDFGQLARRKDDPRPWQRAEADVLRSGWIGLWIDNLDRGGLEEIIALLATEMRRRGLQVRLLCSDRGGLVADRLAGQGFPCVTFGQDAARFEEYLRHDPPLLLSSHYAQRMCEVPGRLGIPIVETIHNMYIHYDESMWENERRRSGYFAHAIAVSELVREYYLHWHGSMGGERVTVVNNAADYRRTLGIDRRWARRMLGIDERTMVLLNVASIDGRKNQCGLLTAFERFHAERPASMLLIMGNNASPFYYNLFNEQLQAAKCRDSVRLLDFHKDTARIFAAADLFVLPSYFEGWSVSATEAAYAGLPIVHTLCGSGPELCGEGGGYLIDNPGGNPVLMQATQLYQDCVNPDPPNTEILVSTMRCACNELDHWRAARHRIRTESIAKYSVRKMIDQYLDIFAKCSAARKQD